VVIPEGFRADVDEYLSIGLRPTQRPAPEPATTGAGL
jgi:hypothetical protein